MHQVTKLHYHQQAKMLDVHFDDGLCAVFSAEFLRVLSPSAEVRGHGKLRLVSHKKQVAISQILPVGLYAAKIVFDDGHNSGIYSWPYLRDLHQNHEVLWQDYLTRLAAANSNREASLNFKQL
ncbi:gamma-butyrobetaine hydroxylase-like domain-containing protein [Rheinheimera sp.]|uniref:gamma-butyrobetaine hydroxylase-like domain-containing protein n=1 Tax=Rheinheimera sp. TaxID=1869214 RepID=UPI0027BACBC3|nr:gamma-butyrobetaine hydroxylase-like domain-containing protein [Rheinheimera sp.]